MRETKERGVTEMSLDEILGDFSTTETETRGSLKGGTVTIWLSPEDKARFSMLQEKSKRQFGKKAREAILALMKLAEKRAS